MYERFARFYDATMGTRASSAELVHTLIQRHAPHARTLLELACGTGSVLQHLRSHYDVVGIDLSPQMLSIARAKLPKVKLHRADMTSFSMRTTFEVIICVFDSVNHLLGFPKWRQLFRRVAEHLDDDGVFIFDIDTERKLQRLIREPAWVKALSGGTLIMKVTDVGKGATNWNIRVFEHVGRSRYRLHEENVREVTFPVERIVAALRQRFSKVRVLDRSGRRPSSSSETLYFVCKR